MLHSYRFALSSFVDSYSDYLNEFTQTIDTGGSFSLALKIQTTLSQNLGKSLIVKRGSQVFQGYTDQTS